MKVYNKNSLYPVDAIYVGRPTIWGNPFRIGPDGTREEVIQKYFEYAINNAAIMDSLHVLRGKSLLCWCAPELCHADILMELAND